MSPQNIRYDLELYQRYPVSGFVDYWSDNGGGGGDCTNHGTETYFQVDSTDLKYGEFQLQLDASINDQVFSATLHATVGE